MSLSFTNFEFTGWDLRERRLTLGYRLSGGDRPDVSFEEELRLPETLDAPDANDPAIRTAAEIVHEIFGVSYYKAACPERVTSAPLPESSARFLDTLYTEGLGEFYFRNGIDPKDRVRFPRLSVSRARAVHRLAANERALVLVGGGKDSVVAREVVRHAGVACDGFSLGTAPWIERSAAAMEVRHHVVGRALDRRLFALNEEGAYNGHVPISACIAAVSLLVAMSGGYTAVIAANERSADEGNTLYDGVEINHQWSKSYRFEQAFRALAAEVIEDAPVYLSALRPMSELSIAREFTRHPQYQRAVTSCNKNFRIQGPRAERRWCGRCPKCVFVYAMVAPHADAALLARVFEGDFLADPENLGLLADLAGVGGMKPFECVGTPLETRAALGRLYSTGRLSPAVAAWYERALNPHPETIAEEWERAMALDPAYRLPGAWQARLDAYLGAH